jgi:hypothetical protein
VEKSVLLEANIDERGANAGHDFGNLAKVDVPHHSFFTGCFNKKFGKLAVFKNGDTMFVRRGVDDNFFFHIGALSTSDSTQWKLDAPEQATLNEVPFGAANNRREKIVFATVQIDQTDAPKMKILGRPTA